MKWIIWSLPTLMAPVHNHLFLPWKFWKKVNKKWIDHHLPCLRSHVRGQDKCPQAWMVHHHLFLPWKFSKKRGNKKWNDHHLPRLCSYGYGQDKHRVLFVCRRGWSTTIFIALELLLALVGEELEQWISWPSPTCLRSHVHGMGKHFPCLLLQRIINKR